MKSTIKIASKSLLFATIIGVALLSSCKKGDTGPAGPQGNANVISSGILSVATSDWINNGPSQYTASFIVNSITPTVVSSGAVMVYEVGSNSSNLALPYTGNGFYSDYGWGNEQVGIVVGTVDGSTASNPGNKQYRIVIIPSSLRKSHPNTNWNDYNEVSPLISKSDVVLSK